MSWIIGVIITIIGIVLFNFLNDVSEDKIELHDQSLDEKFQIVTSTINSAVFDSKGEVTRVNKREFNLFYAAVPNQRIYFFYGTGHLTIIWKYKYFQREVVHEKTFYDVRDANADVQQRIGEIMFKEMEQVVENHKIRVNKELA